MQPPITEEKLSQLMDGEWHELNPSECVARICNDDVLRGKWARYHLVRDAMKGEPVQSDSMMATRICAAIADEPAYSNITPFSTSTTDTDNFQSDTAESSEVPAIPALTPTLSTAPPSTAGKSSWLGTGIAGFAMAASVAAVTVVGMNIWQTQSVMSTDSSVVAARAMSGIDTGIDTDTAFARQVEGAPLPVVEFVANTGSYWVSPQTAERVDAENKLNMFLSQHIENSPTSSREGMLPYSRLVGYDERVKER